MKILLTGNSFIYKGTGTRDANGPAKTFVRLAQEGGHDIETTGTYIGGSVLAQHWGDTKGINPRDELNTGDYDLMVIAGGASGSFAQNADRFADLAEANGTKVLFYGFWAPDNRISSDGGDNFSQSIHNQYTSAANRNDGFYSPNGLAYREAYKALHAKYGKGDDGRTVEDILTYDGIHASPTGAFLVASVLYGTIFGERAPSSWRPSEVSAADAKLLQDIAWKTVQQYAIEVDGSVKVGGSKTPTKKPAPVVSNQRDDDDGSVEGRVFIDDDRNNRDDGDKGLSGVDVALYDKGSNRIVDRDTTDGGGKYKFDDVKAGNYEVRFEDVASRDYVRANVGSDASDSDVSVKWANGGGTTGNINVRSGQSVRDVDAGVTAVAKTTSQPVKAPSKSAAVKSADGSIAGVVFNDQNRNGVDNSNDNGVAGITVQLYQNGKGIVETTKTDGRGNYKFDDLTDGKYSIRFDGPDGGQFSRANVGNDVNDSDVTNVWGNGTGVTQTMTISGGRDLKNVDAGVSFKAPAKTVSKAEPAKKSVNLTGDNGNDRLRGSNEADQIKGNGGRDDLIGNGGNDTLDGGAGVDRAFGGSGNDRIIFDNADSMYYGGGGRDTFVFNGGTSDIDMRVVGVETFDLKNNKSDTLKIGVEDVRQANGLLTITADKGDNVRLDTNQDVRKTGERMIDGEDYDMYSIGGSRSQQFLIDQDANLDIV